ncbi:MAG: LysM peptidoglycan-binding domain-containing protein [Candidatus Hydrogenedentes bacterium]|jgi:beta-N-acetylhexosaminidase|nr:LysM peptidoglycan-binding domain-containing protein [Candidatus Hydrogenedentota bacterium]
MEKQSWYSGDTDNIPIQSGEGKRDSFSFGPSATLLVTFLLGLAVGFLLCYALLEMRQGADDKEAASESSFDGVTETTLVPLQSKGEELDLAVAQVDPESVWPARHLLISLPGTHLDEDSAELLNRFKPGGVWLRQANTVDTNQIGHLVQQINKYAALQGPSAAEPLIVTAQDGGDAANPLRLAGTLAPRDLAQLDTLDAIRAAGKDLAEKSLNLGVGVLLTPVLDIFDPEKQKTSDRYRFLGDSPEAVSQAGIAFAEGLQAGGVMAVAKHYPGIGSASIREGNVPLIAETNVEYLASNMMPFMDAAAYDISGMLISSASVPALDVQQPGRPASLSPVLVREVFRNKWGYSGVLLAEDIRTVASWSRKSVEENVIAALAAGCDAVLISDMSLDDMTRISAAIKDACASGVLSEENLLASRQRLDLWRTKLERVKSQRTKETAAEADVNEDEDTAVPDESAIDDEVADAEEGADESIDEAADEVEEEVAAPAEDTLEEAAPAAEETEPEAPVEAPEKEVKAPEAEVKEQPKKAPVKETATPPEGSKKVEHIIKKGETLTGIAQSYQVSVKNIMTWNNMSDSNIRFGQKLSIFTTKDVADAAPAETQDKAAPEVKAAPEESSDTAAAAEEIVAPADPVEEETAPVEEVQPEPVADDDKADEEPSAPAVDAPAAADQEETPAPDVDTEHPETHVPEQFPPVTEEVLPPVVEISAMPLEPDHDSEDLEITEEEHASTVTKNFSVRSSSGKKEDKKDDKEASVSQESESAAAAEESEEELEMTVTVEPITVETATTVAPAAAEVVAPVPADEAAPVTTSVSSEPEYTEHKIATGENLSQIAKKYNISLQELIKLNNISNPDIVVIGHSLKVPKQ